MLVGGSSDLFIGRHDGREEKTGSGNLKTNKGSGEGTDFIPLSAARVSARIRVSET
jgi:hypothetical protein